MTLSSTRGTMVVDEKKFAYMVVFTEWHIYKKCWITSVYKRTNDRKTAEKALKTLIAKHSEPLEDFKFKYDKDAEAHRAHDERIIETK